MRRTIITAVVTATFIALGASPLWAHATINPSEAPADSYTRFALRIGHGCESSPTTGLAVQIPDGVVAVKPEIVPGWQYETVTGELAEPVELHGEEITEGVREVRWFGGPPIPDEAFQEFGLSVRLPDAPGETLYFPVIQSCEEGEHAWVERPTGDGSEEELEEPAPAVTLVEGDGAHGSSSHGEADGEQASGDVATLSAALADARAAASQARMLAVAALVVALVAGGAVLVSTRRA